MEDAREKSVELEYYDTVQQKQVDWLWYPYIPYGKITLLQGDPGDGKSTFMLHIAAIISTGGIFPDGSQAAESHSVIYQCSEDNAADTIKPRLLAAGADCEKIAYIVEDNQPLALDDPRIEEAVISSGARLVIFDPIQAYIPPESDMLNASKMRTVLRNLAGIAERNNCAVVLIGHMTKASGGKNLYRGLGSIDIAAISRSVLMIKRDEEEPDIRYMFPVKSSLAYEGKAVRFIFDKDLGFRILGTCDMKLDNTDDRDKDEKIGKLQKAERLLRILLSDGSKPSKEVLRQMKQIDISERTVRSVVKKIGVQAFRKGSIWYWKLEGEQPDTTTQEG